MSARYRVINGDGLTCGDPFAECADAAQEAEYLHAKKGEVHRVADDATGEVFYESAGPRS